MVKEEGLIIDGEVYKAQEFKPNICTVTAKKGIDFERIKKDTKIGYGKVSIKFKLDPEADKEIIEFFELLIDEPRFDWRLLYNWFNQQYPNLGIDRTSLFGCCLFCSFCDPEIKACLRNIKIKSLKGKTVYLVLFLGELITGWKCDNHNKREGIL
ncbi:MAG: hypothetical protein AMQ22_00095 [Candidatus Methanofastidiosum methylothiophilum]|uniref:Uncharacterized protein n=1 Tax=Candidatus Methanofastidiosum methylothiophilum TaxID=1705564 RepID=A0A150J9S9_9EURY|nr:MAG: hypothetical protein AMQ22_00095 [Candidatus Methanofastidiosum methylthiophilus]